MVCLDLNYFETTNVFASRVGVYLKGASWEVISIHRKLGTESGQESPCKMETVFLYDPWTLAAMLVICSTCSSCCGFPKNTRSDSLQDPGCEPFMSGNSTLPAAESTRNLTSFEWRLEYTSIASQRDTSCKNS